MSCLTQKYYVILFLFLKCSVGKTTKKKKRKKFFLFSSLSRLEYYSAFLKIKSFEIHTRLHHFNSHYCNAPEKIKMWMENEAGIVDPPEWKIRCSIFHFPNGKEKTFSSAGIFIKKSLWKLCKVFMTGIYRWILTDYFSPICMSKLWSFYFFRGKKPIRMRVGVWIQNDFRSRFFMWKRKVLLAGFFFWMWLTLDNHVDTGSYHLG